MKESNRPAFNIIFVEKIVVLVPTTLTDFTRGSIEVVSDKMPEIGKVIAIGKAKKPLDVKIGDIVAYRRYGESKFFIGGQETVFVSFADILGVIRKE